MPGPRIFDIKWLNMNSLLDLEKNIFEEFRLSYQKRIIAYMPLNLLQHNHIWKNPILQSNIVLYNSSEKVFKRISKNFLN